MIEKRTVPRHKVLKGGTLAFSGGGGVDCTVRNISSNGARVDISSPVGLPEAFTLVIETDHFIRRCHAVWSSEKHIGIAFD
ncbi:MAG TPA: PilZ domain-containing protein [Bradyrhizobium sp.]|jgi:PilZ domain|nr:PilZ domain-containing protein [Bradyrhizobium sp.]